MRKRISLRRVVTTIFVGGFFAGALATCGGSPEVFDDTLPPLPDGTIQGDGGLIRDAARLRHPDGAQIADGEIESDTGPACPVVDSGGAIKTSQIFCGNTRLYDQDDPAHSPWAGGTPTQGHPTIGVDPSGNAVCLWGNVQTDAAAPENFELRGWVEYETGPMCNTPDAGPLEYPDEEEFFIDIQPDIGWTPDPCSGVVALNTLDAIQKYVPGTNIVKFFGRQVFPPNDNTVWASTGEMAIHVEADLWGPTRGGETYTHQPVPPGWVQCGMEETTLPDGAVGDVPTYFSQDVMLDAGTLHPGDYVSLTGVQWRDDTHLNCTSFPDDCDPGVENQTMVCWAVNGIPYWAEMHPPDKIRQLPPPTNRTPSSLIGYATCSVDPTTFTDVVAPTPPDLHRNTRIDHLVTSIVGSSYTETPPLIASSNREITFGFTSQGSMSAWYQVVWGCTPSCDGPRCGTDDGCGGVCALAAVCPTGYTCSADGSCH